MKKDYDEKAYFKHYMEHTYLVVLAWKEIQGILIENDMITKEEFEKINRLIAWHDNSKISKEEWVPYARRFHPIAIQDSKTVKRDFKEAVLHHKDNNRHHFETLKDYQGDDWRCYIIEMVCDYIAMGWEFGTYIFEYYEANKDKITLPSNYRQYLEEVLRILKDPSMYFIEEPMTQKRMTYLVFK